MKLSSLRRSMCRSRRFSIGHAVDFMILVLTLFTICGLLPPVAADKFSVSISPSQAVMDVGQAQLFTSTVTGGKSPYSYQWYLDDAPVSGATDDAWTFSPTTAHSYTVYVVVDSADTGQSAQSNTAIVTVNSAPSVLISPSSAVLGAGQSKLFTSSVSGGTSPYSYRWYLNSNPVSPGTSASWTFTPSSSGSYSVYVRVTDHVGSVVTSNIASVTVNPALRPPVARFTGSAYDVYTDILIQLDASSSYDPDGTITSYYWDFGDGKNTTGEAVSHSYAENGNYTVVLTVTDNDGLTDTDQDTIHVQNRAPIASFTVSSAKEYTDETITFNATSSYDPDGLILLYFWDFGDGINATGMVTPHAYTHEGVYTVNLTVTDDDNDANWTTLAESILSRGTGDHAPIAVFTVSAQKFCTGDSVVLNASGSYDPDGMITSYEWDFGDNFTASGDVVNHVYNEDGNFLVILVVTDNNGLSTSSNTSVIILNRPPYASFECSAPVAHMEENLYFNASTSYDPDGTIASYFWEFGDRTNATGVAVSHQYSQCGNYTVTLTVEDNDGSSNATSLNETIISRSTVASFTILPTHPSPEDPITFNASGSYDLDGTIERYRWNFGDGNTSETSASIITHSYSALGEFNVTLTVFSTRGCNASTTRLLSLQIHDVAIINVALSATEIQVGQIINITVKMRNKGTVSESFNITLFCNETMIASKHVADLSPEEPQDLVFYWNTSNIQSGKFLIQAKADNVEGETALSDNSGTSSLFDISQAENGSSSTSGIDWKWGLLIAPALALLLVALVWRRVKGVEKFTDFEYFNDITNGGIPDSSSVLVTGGPGSGKSVLCQELAHTFLAQKKPCLYVTYDCFPDEVRDNLRKLHSDLQTHEAEKRLLFIDCFSTTCKNKDRDYYLGQSLSLADLGIALSEATSDLGPSSKVVLDSITPLITHTEPLKVIEFLQDRSARIKGAKGTFIFTMGEATIEPNLSNRLEETVDCIIELEKSTNKGKTVRRLRVKKMRGKKTSDRWIRFEIDPIKGIIFPI